MEKRLLILFFCLFVVMAGYGLTLPVLPYYIERLALSEGATSAEAYFQVGLLTGIFAFSQFLFAPIWGKWSDHLGRRPLFLMGLVFVVCGFVMAAAQATVVVWLISRISARTLLQTGFTLMGVGLAMLMTTQNLSFILLYVAIFAFGVALIVPCLASTVSKSAGDRPGAALGQLVSANNLGQASGPIVGGVLFVWQIHAPYLLTALLLLAAAVYVTRSMLLQSV